MNTFGKFWTGKRDARGKELWLLGWTAERIRLEIGAVSRNSVISRAHRAGWDHPTRAEASRARRGKPAAPKPARAPKPVRPVSFSPKRTAGATPPLPFVTDDSGDPGTRKSLFDLNLGECRWPYGDGPFMFCAAATGAAVYCPFHVIVSRQGLAAAQAMAQHRGERYGEKTEERERGPQPAIARQA